MSIRPLLATTAIAMILSASAASAITPEEVWSSWKSQIEHGDGSLTTSAETRNGDVLEISNLVLVLNSPDVTVSVTQDKLLLRDRGDGTVEVIAPDSFPLTISEHNGTTPLLGITISQPGGSVIASGTADALNFAFNYPTTTATLTELDAGEAGSAKPEVDGTFTITNLTGNSKLSPQGTDLVAYDYSYALDGMTLTLTGTKTATGESLKAEATLGASSATGNGVATPKVPAEDYATSLRAGAAISATAKTGPLNASFEFSETERTSSGALSFAATEFNLHADKARLDYGTVVQDLNLRVTTPATGLTPSEISLSEFVFGVALPLAKRDTAEDFSFLLRLVDLTASESLWSMVDPAAQLARDPATFVVDLKGKGAWNVDVTSLADRGMVELPDMLVRLDSLDLSEILLRIVGGEVAATGALTFDNGDLRSFGGLPAPEGTINVTMKGINALIDKAVAMGLIPQNDLMGVRMGLAMFTRPGPTPDSLVSDIVLKDKGLFVNGQQLQ